MLPDLTPVQRIVVVNPPKSDLINVQARPVGHPLVCVKIATRSGHVVDMSSVMIWYHGAMCIYGAFDTN